MPREEDEDPMTSFFRRSSSRRSSVDGERIEPDGYEWNVGDDDCPEKKDVGDGNKESIGVAMARFFGRSSSGRNSTEGERPPAGYEWKLGRDDARGREDGVDPMSEFFQRSSSHRNSSCGKRLESGYQWISGDDKPPGDAIRKDGISSFTASLAFDPARLRQRTTTSFCALNVVQNSAILDQVLGVTSAFSFFGLIFIILGGLVCLVPSMIFSKMMGWHSFISKPSAAARGDGNISTTEVGSVTAIKALVARSQMNRQGSGGPDSIAPLLMDQTSALGPNIPGSQLYSRFFLLMERIHFYLTGRLFQDQMAQMMKDTVKFGPSAYLQVRTCWLDDCLETFIRKNTRTKSGKANVNVVILGAGYDTRSYRMNLAERGARSYEVDAPGTQAMKKDILMDAGVDPGSTTFVSCDFEREDWLEKLKCAGFDVALPTFLVWEGVTMYISQETVTATINKVGLLANGSMIGFDYLDRTWALSETLTKLSKRGREPWIFGMTSTEMEQLIEKCNKKSANSDSSHQLMVLDHLEHTELARRYLATHYDGRPIGYLADFGGFVLAGSA